MPFPVVFLSLLIFLDSYLEWAIVPGPSSQDRLGLSRADMVVYRVEIQYWKGVKA